MQFSAGSARPGDNAVMQTSTSAAIDRLYAEALAEFADLYAQAQATGMPDPNAMTVASSTADGRPSARIALLKGHDARGFVFYTNHDSRKGRELRANPRAALLFFWKALGEDGVQVRVEGEVEIVAAAEADAYFASRPRDSRLGAWASQQSEALDSRETFEQRFDEVRQRYEGVHVPRPPHWGGFRVVPQSIEIWRGARFRLHERYLYERGAEGVWTKRMLYP
jgi:pyridoxamine 5'-phosphate oxidase